MLKQLINYITKQGSTTQPTNNRTHIANVSSLYKSQLHTRKCNYKLLMYMNHIVYNVNVTMTTQQLLFTIHVEVKNDMLKEMVKFWKYWERESSCWRSRAHATFDNLVTYVTRSISLIENRCLHVLLLSSLVSLLPIYMSRKNQ